MFQWGSLCTRGCPHSTNADLTYTSRTSVQKGDDSNQPTKVMTTFTNNLPHGCLRRVVKRVSVRSCDQDYRFIGFSIRTPGWSEVWLYSSLSHRFRCVWKLCVVDNPRDLKLLSVKEQRAQKLLRKVFRLNNDWVWRSKARAGLNKSKLNRLGGRVHEGYILPDGKSLTGGEKFPTMLRSIVSSTTLKMETHELKERRDKVEHNFLANITSFRKKISQVTSRSYIKAVI